MALPAYVNLELQGVCGIMQSQQDVDDDPDNLGKPRELLWKSYFHWIWYELLLGVLIAVGHQEQALLGPVSGQSMLSRICLQEGLQPFSDAFAIDDYKNTTFIPHDVPDDMIPSSPTKAQQHTFFGYSFCFKHECSKCGDSLCWTCSVFSDISRSSNIFIF